MALRAALKALEAAQQQAIRAQASYSAPPRSSNWPADVFSGRFAKK